MNLLFAAESYIFADELIKKINYEVFKSESRPYV